MELAHPFLVIRDFEPIWIHAQVRPATDEEYAAFMHQQSMHLLEAKERTEAGDTRGMILISPTSHDMALPPQQRRMAADWLAQHREFLSQICHASYPVIPGKLLRAGLTAVMWLSKPAFPIRPCADLETACNRALAHADSLGMALPSDLTNRGADAIRDAIANLTGHEQLAG